MRNYLGALVKKSILPPGTVLSQAAKDADIQDHPIHHGLLWKSAIGMPTTDQFGILKSSYGISDLILEDMANSHILPKLDRFDSALFVVMKMPVFDNGIIRYEHIAFYLTQSLLISIQQLEGDTFSPIVERYKSGSGRVIERQGDYLLYLLMDLIAGGYFLCLKAIDEYLVSLANQSGLDTAFISRLQSLKKDVTTLKRYALYTEMVTDSLKKMSHPLIETKTTKYYQDLSDHVAQINEIVTDIAEEIRTKIDQRVMEINLEATLTMRQLTVVASIFLPLTFVTGYFGMNLLNLPGSSWAPMSLFLSLAMCILVLVMLLVYRRSRWM